jgi:hypothetical protein
MSKRKIIIRLIGGLGNQLFQIQYAILLQEKLGGIILVDDSFLAASSKSHEKIAILPLVIPYKIIRLGWVDLNIKRVIEKIFHLLRFRLPICFRPVFLFENSKVDLEIMQRIIIDGFWQDVSYLNKSFIQTVRKSLIINNNLENLNIGNLVCVHVRRGDYLNNKHWFVLQQEIVSLSYYFQAFDYFKKEIINPLFEIYTDDELWALETFGNMNNVRVVKSKEFLPNVLLSRMASYQNYIIANSTLSWWAAVLSQKTDKKVVFPNRWSKNMDSKKFQLKGWVSF